MSKKSLLLTAGYEVLSFVNERKTLKLLYKDKVEVISSWDDVISWGKETVKYPAILRLKNSIKRHYYNSNFSRKALVKRDKSICQFCQRKLSASQITIDHVIPRAHGGITSFTNCVVCCQNCNSIKADRTPEQANMVLLKKPTQPTFSSSLYVVDPQQYWHPEWDNFIGRN